MFSLPGLAILSFLSCAYYVFDKAVKEFSRQNYHGNITKKSNLKIFQACRRQKKGTGCYILELICIQRVFSFYYYCIFQPYTVLLLYISAVHRTITVHFSTQYYLNISFLNSCLLHVLLSPWLLQKKQLFSLYELS